MRSVADRVIVVTGATSGIGQETARRLAAAGATVVAVARDLERLRLLARELPGLEIEPCDLADADRRADLIDRVLRRHGAVDGLVNGAAVGWQGEVVEMSRDDLERLYATNTVAVLDLCRMLLPGMIVRGDGDIVVISSVLAWMAAPPLTVYGSTKAAVEAFADGLRREALRHGVRVHVVRPGPVATEFLVRSVGWRPRARDLPVAPAPGVSPTRVAVAIERCLRSSYPRRQTVPRVLAATQIVRLQPIRPIADAATAALAGPLVRFGRALANNRMRSRTADGTYRPEPPGEHRPPRDAAALRRGRDADATDPAVSAVTKPLSSVRPSAARHVPR